MKRWRLAQFHPEDRYEPDDDVADRIREEIRKLDTHSTNSWVKLKKLRVELAERLYGK
jgi:hypothetical protein